jgi:hypothetical protein
MMFTRASSAVFTAEDRSTAGLGTSSSATLFCVVKVDDVNDDDDDVFSPMGASL